MNQDDLESPSRDQVQRSDEHPQVMRVVGPRMCTGTLVSRHTMLTASHCLREARPRVVVGGQQLKTTRFRILGQGEKNDPADVAVMFFNEDIAQLRGIEPMGLAERVQPGAVVRMVGYGCGQRGMGTNRVFRIRDFVEVLWSRPAPARHPFPDNGTAMLVGGPVNRAETCPGDSGGPALVQEGSEWRVAGVLHGLLMEGSRTLSVYSNVTEGQNRDFVRSAIAESR